MGKDGKIKVKDIEWIYAFLFARNMFGDGEEAIEGKIEYENSRAILVMERKDFAKLAEQSESGALKAAYAAASDLKRHLAMARMF